ncbi:hypothetical protein ACFFUB_11260 [Algimonas porphyrae]|nr:hypothetical protein [Algimonas porphyrae]
MIEAAHLSILISALALGASIFAVYATNFWRGTVKASRPSQFFIAYSEDDSSKPTLSVSVFLYSTGNAGRLIEHLYITARQSEKIQNFTTWYAGTTHVRNKFAGIKVDRNGLSLNNLFYPPHGETSFQFSQGEIEIELLCRLAGSDDPKTLSKVKLILSEHQIIEMNDGKIAVFDIQSSGRGYHGYTDTYKKSMDQEMAEKFSAMADTIKAKALES